MARNPNTENIVEFIIKKTQLPSFKLFSASVKARNVSLWVCLMKANKQYRILADSALEVKYYFWLNHSHPAA